MTVKGSSIYWTLLILKKNDKYCSSPDQVEKCSEDTIIMPDVSDEILMQKPMVHSYLSGVGFLHDHVWLTAFANISLLKDFLQLKHKYSRAQQ